MRRILSRFLCPLLCLCLLAGLTGCGELPAPGGKPSSASSGAAGSSQATGVSPEKGMLQPLTQDVFGYGEFFHNGYAFAVRDNDCGYLDLQGNFAPYYKIPSSGLAGSVDLSLLFEEYTSLLDQFDHNQMFVSEEGLFPWYDEDTGLWGYGDIHTGKWVIEPAYLDAFPFSEQRAVVCPGRDGAAQVIDTDGNVLFEIGAPLELCYDTGSLHALGPVPGGSPDHAYLIGRDGDILAELPYFGIKDSGNAHRIPDVPGGRIGRADPDHIFVMGAVVQLSGELEFGDFYYLDRDGNEVARPPEGSIWAYPWEKGAKASCYMMEEDQTGLFDENGKITEPIYSDIQYLSEDFIFVQESDGSWHPINAQGEPVGDETFEDCLCFRDNELAAVCKDGLWGYLDTKGQFAIEPTFAQATIFYDGVAIVSLEGEDTSFFIDTEGKAISDKLELGTVYWDKDTFLYQDGQEAYHYLGRA